MTSLPHSKTFKNLQKTLNPKLVHYKKSLFQKRFDRGFAASPAALTKTLEVKYVNSVRGWRACFAPDALDHVGFQQFALGCKKCGYTGSLKKIWKRLREQFNPAE